VKKGEWESVVAEGVFEELPDRIGTKRIRDHAWSLLSEHANWQPGTLKPGLPPLQDEQRRLFFRIRIVRMSGRAAQQH
jgi:nitroimidazol reductase NimA-like FMN-containing flavoprotein (pyridoxamine 5'-phosphate oxidase superfamily)